jgi:hypothetical protein
VIAGGQSIKPQGGGDGDHRRTLIELIAQHAAIRAGESRIRQKDMLHLDFYGC